MRIKSFTSGSMKEAMTLVRKELGEDAIILSTQDESDGTVTLTAALERGAGLLINNHEKTSDHLQLVAEVLDFHGFPQSSRDVVLASAARIFSDDPIRVLGEALAKELNLRAAAFDLSERPIMLVGAPGAGKTSVAAKIAMAARLKGRSVHFINHDTAKSGASARLKAFASHMGATHLEVSAACDVRASLGPKGAMTIIDTPGQNPFNPAELANIQAFGRTADADLVYVTAAGGDRSETIDAARAFAKIGARCLIATRLDAARRLAAPLAAAKAAGLYLVAISDTPEITGGFADMSANAIARRLIAALSSSNPSLARMEVA